MALNVTEAHDVNTLLLWLIGDDEPLRRRPGKQEAREAAMRLADKANRTLMAGFNSGRILARWGNAQQVVRAGK